jgi:Tol biopolymer transport system component
MQAAGGACSLAALAVAVATTAAAAQLPGRIVVSATDAPTAYDLKLVTAAGATRDIAHVDAPDAAPSVSPDGTLVAFRLGDAEWVVSVSGTGLRRITPAIDHATSQVAWAPDSKTLAVLDGSAVYRASASGGVWKRIARLATGLVAWSPDGARLAYVTTLASVDIVKPNGTRVLDAIGSAGSWSPSGRLAVQRTSTAWDVYSEAGKHLAGFAATAAVWSTRGALATIDGAGVVRIRPGGVGRPTVTARPIRRDSQIRWAGPTHLLVDGVGSTVLFDVEHRKTFIAPSAYGGNPSLASDGSVFGEVRYGTLVHATLSGSTRTVSTFAGGCGGTDTDPYGSLQALPDGSAAVYESSCVPAHDLFSLQPDGSGLTHLTQTPQDEIDPALSPDGTHVAFARTDTGGCVGCNSQIWITARDGSGARSVTLPSDPSSILQDDGPSFSPDGTKIVFARWDAALTGDTAALAEAPATGGTATVLKVPGGNPAWGPSRIAFDSAKGDVETIAPDGSDATAVPGTAIPDGGVPAWSPGGRLAVLRPAAVTFSIYFPATKTSIDLPGVHQAVGPAPGLAWSPDGTMLAFTAADSNGEGDVWVVNADGTRLTRITHGLGADGALSWR